MRVSDAPKIMRSVGLEVIEFNRPFGRGRSMSAIEAIVWHDTVTGPNWSDVSVANLLQKGRPGVPGPLSQNGEDRRGRIWFIADGKANHNGYGKYKNNAIGFEVFCAGGLKGQEEPYNAIQRKNTAIAAAALSKAYSVPVVRNLGHKETDPKRKIDPYGVSMAEMRRMVEEAMMGVLIGDTEDEMRIGHKDTAQNRTLQTWYNLYFHGEADPRKAGKNFGCHVDGIFGPELQAYTAEFQHRVKFDTTGVVDLMTMARLESRLIQRGYIAPAGDIRKKWFDEQYERVS